MATIKTSMRSYDAPTLTPEPNTDTWEELRDTFAYLRDKKIPITIEHIGENEILLGMYYPEAREYIRLDLINLTF